MIGPGPYGDHATNANVEAAVAAERERCAALAESWAQAEQGDARNLLLRLAGALREMWPPGPEMTPL